MDIKSSINLLLEYKEKIDADLDNHYYIFPFIAIILNLTDDKGFVSEDGFKMLRNPITNDFQIINENPENPSQKALTRICLYFALIHNLIIFYTGFINILETEEGKKYADKFPPELIEYLKEVHNRIFLYKDVTKAQLENLLPKLTQKYAYIFGHAKNAHWIKDIYQEDVIKIPTHPDDLPEGFSTEKCINVSK